MKVDSPPCHQFTASVLTLSQHFDRMNDKFASLVEHLAERELGNALTPLRLAGIDSLNKFNRATPANIHSLQLDPLTKQQLLGLLPAQPSSLPIQPAGPVRRTDFPVVYGPSRGPL